MCNFTVSQAYGGKGSDTFHKKVVGSRGGRGPPCPCPTAGDSTVRATVSACTVPDFVEYTLIRFVNIAYY